MTLQIVAIIFISLITGFITLTFAAYQKWRLKMFERKILKCIKIVRRELDEYKKMQNSNSDWRQKNNAN